jgi:hypothetical protein
MEKQATLPCLCQREKEEEKKREKRGDGNSSEFSRRLIIFSRCHQHAPLSALPGKHSAPSTGGMQFLHVLGKGTINRSVRWSS